MGFSTLSLERFGQGDTTTGGNEIDDDPQAQTFFSLFVCAAICEVPPISVCMRPFLIWRVPQLAHLLLLVLYHPKGVHAILNAPGQLKPSPLEFNSEVWEIAALPIMCNQSDRIVLFIHPAQ